MTGLKKISRNKFFAIYIIAGVLISFLSLLPVIITEIRIERIAYYAHIIIVCVMLAVIYFSAKFIYRKASENRSILLYVFLTILFSFLCFYPVLAREGWPYNHEWYGWRDRIVCYAQHFLQLDFFPYWSNGDAMGMGAPLPLYYHKTFYYLSGAFCLITDNVKASVIISLAILNTIGVYGIYRTLRMLNLTVFTSACFAWSFLFLNYGITNWFIRGAFAEYSALMFVPWLFYWIIKFLKTKEYCYSIIWIFIAVVLSHNIIAYFSVFMLIAAVLINFVLSFNKPFLWYLAKRIFVSGASVLLILSLYIIPTIIISPYYDPAKIKLNIWDFFISYEKYFLDAEYSWPKTWQGYTVQLTATHTISVLAGLILLITSLFIKKVQKIYTASIGRDNIIPFFFFSFFFLFYFFLQLRIAYPFYTSIPGADFIQFPWRLLCFLQTILLIFVALITICIRKEMYRNITSAILLGILVVTYPILKPTDAKWQWFPADIINLKINGGLFGIGEYMPNVDGLKGTEEVYEYFLTLSQQGVLCTNDTSGNIRLIESHNAESIQIKYDVVLNQESEVVFPKNYSGMEKLYVLKNSEKIKKEVYRLPNDPRMRVVLPEGKYSVKIYLPSLLNVFK